MLAFFLVLHVGAVLFGRQVLGLDTNFYYAAAGMHVSPYGYFFAPYYFLAVLALFAYLGCAAYWRFEASSSHVRRWAVGLPLLAGFIIAALLVLSLAGRLQPFEVPQRYLATFGIR